MMKMKFLSDRNAFAGRRSLLTRWPLSTGSFIFQISLFFSWWYIGNAVTQKRTKNSVSMIFGGDTDFSRITHYTHRSRNCSYEESLKRIQGDLKSADFVMINLETTLGESKPSEMNPNAITTLWSDEAVVPALKSMGVDYVNLANNHILDFQVPGLNRTAKILRKYGIGYSGIVHGNDRYAKQKPLIIEKNGIKIGILSYCDLDKWCKGNWKRQTSGPVLLKFPNVLNDVKSLRTKDKVDIVVLFLHWGLEYGSIVDSGIVTIIRKLTRNAKIDLIVGSHPHVTQKHWYTKNTLVATSLGNLYFSPYLLANYNFNGESSGSDYALYERLWYKQMGVMKDGTRQGRLLKVTFNKTGIVKEKSQYLATKIFATKNHCLATDKEDKAKWRLICGAHDLECTGTPTCNYIECEEDETLPPEMIESPPKININNA